MASRHDEHAHEHQIVEIADSGNVTAFEQPPDGVIVLQLHERGFMMELSFDEALELGMVMKKVVDHVSSARGGSEQ